jgi:hypothetical protein
LAGFLGTQSLLGPARFRRGQAGFLGCLRLRRPTSLLSEPGCLRQASLLCGLGLGGHPCLLGDPRLLSEPCCLGKPGFGGCPHLREPGLFRGPRLGDALVVGGPGLRLLAGFARSLVPLAGYGPPNAVDQAGLSLRSCRRLRFRWRHGLLVRHRLAEPLQELPAVATERVRRTVLEPTVRAKDHVRASPRLTSQSIARS